MIYKIIYNWYEFSNNSNTNITYSDDDNWSKIDIDFFSNPYKWGEKIVNALQKRKIITIKWSIKKDTLWGLNEEINIIKNKVLQPVENDIYIYKAYTNNTHTYVWKAICINPDSFIERYYYNINTCKYTLKLLIPAWYIEDLNNTLDITQNFTSNWSLSLSYWWNHITEINLNFKLNTVWDITSIYINIWNLILITDNIYTLQDWDIITIDSKNQNVLLNWNQLEFIWTFPLIYKDETIYFKFKDENWNDVSNWNIDVNIKFKNKYI